MIVGSPPRILWMSSSERALLINFNTSVYISLRHQFAEAVGVPQEATGIVVVCGAGHRPATYLDYGSVGQVEEGNAGFVAIEHVEVILQVLLVAGELEELAVIACLLCVLDKVVKVLVYV